MKKRGAKPLIIPEAQACNRAHAESVALYGSLFGECGELLAGNHVGYETALVVVFKTHLKSTGAIPRGAGNETRVGRVSHEYDMQYQ